MNLVNPYRFASGGGANPNMKLLLHMDGSNGSTTFTDTSASPKTVTARGNAQVTTATKKFGTGGLALDGTGDYLEVTASSAFDFGTADFSIEFFVNFQGSGSQYLLDFSTVNTSVIQVTPSSGNMFVYSQASHCINAGSTPFDLNTWYHIALIRSGGTWTIYRDGVQYLQAAGQTTRTFGSSSLNMYIGIAGNGGVPTQAVLDEFAVFHEAITPGVPTGPYTDA